MVFWFQIAECYCSSLFNTILSRVTIVSTVTLVQPSLSSTSDSVLLTASPLPCAVLVHCPASEVSLTRRGQSWNGGMIEGKRGFVFFSFFLFFGSLSMASARPSAIRVRSDGPGSMPRSAAQPAAGGGV